MKNYPAQNVKSAEVGKFCHRSLRKMRLGRALVKVNKVGLCIGCYVTLPLSGPQGATSNHKHILGTARVDSWGEEQTCMDCEGKVQLQEAG